MEICNMAFVVIAKNDRDVCEVSVDSPDYIAKIKELYRLDYELVATYWLEIHILEKGYFYLFR